jgi:triacylglycerol esterase/lipase EstA (alpha/beta hydrolase family)
MISRLKPPNVRVLSLTTVATPHRGSSYADYIFKRIGPLNIPKLYKALEFFGFETGAFQQLTQEYMAKSFNPRTPDLDSVRYYSYGASVQPRITSIFRHSHGIVEKYEGANDGLVSVQSSKWGTYKGTQVDSQHVTCIVLSLLISNKGTLNHVSHLDLINWTNRLRWFIWRITGRKRK